MSNQGLWHKIHLRYVGPQTIPELQIPEHFIESPSARANRKALCALCSTCRWFSDAAYRWLYRYIIFRAPSDQYRNGETLLLFLRTMLEAPKLRTLVERIACLSTLLSCSPAIYTSPLTTKLTNSYREGLALVRPGTAGRPVSVNLLVHYGLQDVIRRADNRCDRRLLEIVGLRDADATVPNPLKILDRYTIQPPPPFPPPVAHISAKLFVLIISLTTELERLFINVYPYRAFNIEPQNKTLMQHRHIELMLVEILGDADTRADAFGKLQELELWRWVSSRLDAEVEAAIQDEEDFVVPGPCQGLAFLPNLKIVDIRDTIPDRPRSRIVYRPKSSKVAICVPLTSTIPQRLFPKLGMWMFCVTRLKIVGNPGESGIFDIGLLCRTIANSFTSLERLYLRTMQEWPNRRCEGWLEDLGRLTSLRVLSTELPLLVGDPRSAHVELKDVLPKSLQHLRLFDPRRTGRTRFFYLRKLLALAANCQEYLPRLENVDYMPDRRPRANEQERPSRDFLNLIDEAFQFAVVTFDVEESGYRLRRAGLFRGIHPPKQLVRSRTPSPDGSVAGSSTTDEQDETTVGDGTTHPPAAVASSQSSNDEGNETS